MQSHYDLQRYVRNRLVAEVYACAHDLIEKLGTEPSDLIRQVTDEFIAQIAPIPKSYMVTIEKETFLTGQTIPEYVSMGKATQTPDPK